MKLNIDQYCQEGQAFVNKTAQALGTPDDTNHAGRSIVALLHTLRECITPSQSMHLISQLPMIIKGIYVHDWKITEKPGKIDDEVMFLNRVRAHYGKPAPTRMAQDEEVRENIQSVMHVLREYIADGELTDLKSQLPESIGHLLEGVNPLVDNRR